MSTVRRRKAQYQRASEKLRAATNMPEVSDEDFHAAPIEGMDVDPVEESDAHPDDEYWNRSATVYTKGVYQLGPQFRGRMLAATVYHPHGEHPPVIEHLAGMNHPPGSGMEFVREVSEHASRRFGMSVALPTRMTLGSRTVARALGHDVRAKTRTVEISSEPSPSVTVSAQMHANPEYEKFTVVPSRSGEFHQGRAA